MNKETIKGLSHKVDLLESKLKELAPYRDIVRVLPYPMSLISQNHEYLLVNDIYAGFFGIEPSRIVGRKVSEFFTREQFTNDIRPRLEQCLQGNEVRYEIRVDMAKMNPENPVWMEVTYCPYRDNKGNIAGIVSLAFDITGRKKAELKAEEIELRLRNIFDQTFQLAGILEPDGTLLAANRTSLEFIGADEEDVIGKPFWETPWWSHSKILQEWLREAVTRAARGENQLREVDHQTPSGDLHYFDFSLKPVRDGRGAVIYLIPESHDITMRKLAEKALQESRNHLRLFIDSSPDLCFLKDTRGRYLLVNTANAELFGKSESEILGKTDFELMPEESARQCWETDQQAMTTKKVVINEERFGDEIYETRKIPVFSNSEVVGVAGVLRKVTDMARLLREKFDLEQQYYQAQKLESIGRLAGGVAHDLNNLLTPILGYGEILGEDGIDGDRKKRMADSIVSAAQRARNLVRQLLAFSRKQNLEFRQVDLNQLLGEFRNLLRRTIREDINLVLDLAESLPAVQGDPGQLEQVVMNLAVNAQDAMPKGGELFIETRLVELDENYAAAHQGVKPGDYVMMAVSDTGCGMSEDIQKKLFEPFFTTKSKETGTGLGLATAYGIIKQHGGNIWAYSEPDRGSTFKVYLPAAEPVSGASSGRELDDETLEGNESILLVEDNEQVRTLAETILKKKGYKVVSAENGIEALEKTVSFETAPDLLLTDVIMPEMNGKQLLDKLSLRYPDIKVLFMSGYTEDVLSKQDPSDLIPNFIQKPFPVKALLSRVREVLDN